MARRKGNKADKSSQNKKSKFSETTSGTKDSEASSSSDAKQDSSREGRRKGTTITLGELSLKKTRTRKTNNQAKIDEIKAKASDTKGQDSLQSKCSYDTSSSISRVSSGVDTSDNCEKKPVPSHKTSKCTIYSENDTGKTSVLANLLPKDTSENKASPILQKCCLTTEEVNVTEIDNNNDTAFLSSTSNYATPGKSDTTEVKNSKDIALVDLWKHSPKDILRFSSDKSNPDSRSTLMSLLTDNDTDEETNPNQSGGVRSKQCDYDDNNDKVLKPANERYIPPITEPITPVKESVLSSKFSDTCDKTVLMTPTTPTTPKEVVQLRELKKLQDYWSPALALKDLEKQPRTRRRHHSLTTTPTSPKKDQEKRIASDDKKVNYQRYDDLNRGVCCLSKKFEEPKLGILDNPLPAFQFNAETELKWSDTEVSPKILHADDKSIPTCSDKHDRSKAADDPIMTNDAENQSIEAELNNLDETMLLKSAAITCNTSQSTGDSAIMTTQSSLSELEDVNSSSVLEVTCVHKVDENLSNEIVAPSVRLGLATEYLNATVNKKERKGCMPPKRSSRLMRKSHPGYSNTDHNFVYTPLNKHGNHHSPSPPAVREVTAPVRSGKSMAKLVKQQRELEMMEKRKKKYAARDGSGSSLKRKYTKKDSTRKYTKRKETMKKNKDGKKKRPLKVKIRLNTQKQQKKQLCSWETNLFEDDDIIEDATNVNQKKSVSNIQLKIPSQPNSNTDSKPHIKPVASEEELCDKRLEKHACVLWSSEQRRRFQQEHPNFTLEELDNIMREHWEKLSDKEKARYFQRARNAIIDRNKHSTNKRRQNKRSKIDNQAKTGSSANTGISEDNFYSLAAERQQKIIQRKLEDLRRAVPRTEYEKFIGDFRKSYHNTKESIKLRSAEKLLQKDYMEGISRRLLYSRLKRYEPKVDRYKEQKVRNLQRRMSAKMNRLIGNILSGKKGKFNKDVICLPLSDLLEDLGDIDQVNTLITGCKPEADQRKFDNILQNLKSKEPLLKIKIDNKEIKITDIGNQELEKDYLCSLSLQNELPDLSGDDVDDFFKSLSNTTLLSDVTVAKSAKEQLHMDAVSAWYRDRHGWPTCCPLESSSCIVSTLVAADETPDDEPQLSVSKPTNSVKDNVTKDRDSCVNQHVQRVQDKVEKTDIHVETAELKRSVVATIDNSRSNCNIAKEVINDKRIPGLICKPSVRDVGTGPIINRTSPPTTYQQINNTGLTAVTMKNTHQETKKHLIITTANSNPVTSISTYEITANKQYRSMDANGHTTNIYSGPVEHVAYIENCTDGRYRSSQNVGILANHRRTYSDMTSNTMPSCQNMLSTSYRERYGTPCNWSYSDLQWHQAAELSNRQIIRRSSDTQLLLESYQRQHKNTNQQRLSRSYTELRNQSSYIYGGCMMYGSDGGMEQALRHSGYNDTSHKQIMSGYQMMPSDIVSQGNQQKDDSSSMHSTVAARDTNVTSSVSSN